MAYGQSHMAALSSRPESHEREAIVRRSEGTSSLHEGSEHKVPPLRRWTPSSSICSGRDDSAFLTDEHGGLRDFDVFFFRGGAIADGGGTLQFVPGEGSAFQGAFQRLQ